jgi:hypothetical protein
MVTNKKIALVTAILELSIEITNKSDIDIFCDFASHVNSFTVRIVLKGWNNESYETDFRKTMYLDWNCEAELQEVLDYIKEVKEKI